MSERISSEVLDRLVLEALLTRSRNATYVIRNHLDWPGKPLHRRGLKTAQVLRACRRLQHRGLLYETSSSYLVMKCWALTDAGRAALSKAEGREGES